MTVAASQWQELLGEWAQPGEVVDGKYRLDRIIGTGGMGVVVEAWHVRFDEQVALKVLLPDAAANAETRLRFEREARAAFKIKSEHVARVLDVGTLPKGAPYMVMEYLDGQDLADLLGKGHRFEIHDAVDHVLQACAGVAQAHALGIVHRDLKPENLFLVDQRDGTQCIKVLDFGISKVTAASGVRMRALTTGSVTMGTPHYMAPEQWQSARDVTAAADFWALGVILFELLTGKTPFEARELGELCKNVLTLAPRSLRELRPEVPAQLEAAVMCCLHKDTAQRFGSAAELARALAPYATSRGRGAARRIAGVREEDIPTSSDPVTRRKGSAVLHAARTNVSTLRSQQDPPRHSTMPMIERSAEQETTMPSGAFAASDGAGGSLRRAPARTPRAAIIVGSAVGLVLVVALIAVAARKSPPETLEVASDAPPSAAPPPPAAKPSARPAPPPPAPPPAQASASASAKPRPPKPKAVAPVPRKEPDDDVLKEF